MGDSARMSRATRFIDVFDDHVDRRRIGKVFKIASIGLGMDDSDGHSVTTYAALVEVTKTGKAKRGGMEIEVALEDGHCFDPDWTDHDDFIERAMDSFGMTEDEAEKAWSRVNDAED